MAGLRRLIFDTRLRRSDQEPRCRVCCQSLNDIPHYGPWCRICLMLSDMLEAWSERKSYEYTADPYRSYQGASTPEPRYTNLIARLEKSFSAE